MPSDKDMHFEVIADDGRTIVRCRGELDASNAVDVKARIVSLLNGYKEMALDLAGIAFLDSAGVTCLVHAGREARTQGIELSIAKINPSMKRILERAQIWEYLKVADGVGLNRSDA